MSEIKRVYAAIAAVADAISKIGIAKDNTNQMQKYKFRGIDDVYNALAPLLAKHKLVILPRVTERSLIERESKNGGTLFYVTVTVAFDFVSAEDGSCHTIVTMGEAMDSGDKATNKAMSAAYKYAAFQAFCIPTEGDNDADGMTHEVTPTSRPVAQSTTIAMPQRAPESEVRSRLGAEAQRLKLTASEMTRLLTNLKFENSHAVTADKLEMVLAAMAAVAAAKNNGHGNEVRA